MGNKDKVIKNRSDIEQAVYGWENLAYMFGFSKSKVIKYQKELSEAGAIFYTRKGFNPARRVMGFFPSIVKAWVIRKSSQGERL